MTAPVECMCCGEVATLRAPDGWPVCAECGEDRCGPWYPIDPTPVVSGPRVVDTPVGSVRVGGVLRGVWAGPSWARELRPSPVHFAAVVATEPGVTPDGTGFDRLTFGSGRAHSWQSSTVVQVFRS